MPSIVEDMPIDESLARTATDPILIEKKVPQAVMDQPPIRELERLWMVRLAAADDDRTLRRHALGIALLVALGGEGVVFKVLEGYDGQYPLVPQALDFASHPVEIAGHCARVRLAGPSVTASFGIAAHKGEAISVVLDDFGLLALLKIGSAAVSLSALLFV